ITPQVIARESGSCSCLFQPLRRARKSTLWSPPYGRLSPGERLVRQLELRHDLLFRLFREVARELVARRLVVDVNLADQAECGGVVEGADSHDVAAGRLQVIEETGAALAAEAARSPIGRIVGLEVFLSLEPDASDAGGEHRAARPAAAHAAVAGLEVRLHIVSRERHRAAQPFSGPLSHCRASWSLNRTASALPASPSCESPRPREEAPRRQVTGRGSRGCRSLPPKPVPLLF